MSHLTVELLGGARCKNCTHWRKRLLLVADRLVATYGTPSLGNYRDPVKEIIYILLSARTNERLYRSAFHQLLRRFPTLEAIAQARRDRIQRCVRGAGLGMKRAKQIRLIARALLRDFGDRARSKMRRMPPAEIYNYLIHLPGIGPKSALCTMMYSLEMDVFPVDANIRRVLERMGAAKSPMKHYQAQATLPALVPPGRSKDVHVSLVIHGRTTCTPRYPHCDQCPIADLCRTGQRIRSAASGARRRPSLRG